MALKILIGAFWASCFFSVFAQKVDTLAPADIVTRRIPNLFPTAAPSFEIQRNNTVGMDALTAAGLLEQYSMATLRGYGPQALQTASFRGLPGVGTQILLGTQPINSPINGVFDLNLLPAFFLSSIYLQPGGSGGSFGGGAVSGNISLQPDRSKGSKILIQGGNYGFWNIGAKVSFCNNLKFYIFKEENKLNYPLPKSLHGFSPSNRLENSQSQKTAMQLTWGKRGLIQAVKSIRQLPIAVTTGNGTAIQTDQSLRFQDGQQLKKSNHLFEIEQFGSLEWNQYEDSKISMNDTNLCGWLGSQQRWKFQYRKHFFSIENGIQGYWARSPYYANDFRGTRWNASGKWLFKGKDTTFRGHVLVRKEQFKSTFSPWIFDFLSEKSFSKFTSKFHVGQVFRFPTLNDWYWRPGGDSTLLPENGWNLEGGLVFKHVEATAFGTFLSQQILWVPTPSGFWKAENAGKTRTLGLEWKIKNLGINQWRGEINGTYQLPRQKKSTWVPLLYQPDWKIQTKWSSNWSGFKIEMSFVAQGKRNVTTDGSFQLPAQCQANIWMDFSEKLPTGVVGKLGVQNVFGNQWWYLPYLPAPKFQVQLQIQYHFYE